MKKEYVMYFLLININQSIYSRKTAELLENAKYDSRLEFENDIKISLDVNFPNYDLYCLSDFMDKCNNQEIDLKNNWISYVHILE